MSERETGKASVRCRLLSVRREAANRVTINCCGSKGGWGWSTHLVVAHERLGAEREDGLHGVALGAHGGPVQRGAARAVAHVHGPRLLAAQQLGALHRALATPRLSWVTCRGTSQ